MSDLGGPSPTPPNLSPSTPIAPPPAVSTPVSGGMKVLLISTLIVGVIVALLTTWAVVQAAYTTATGKVMGEDMARGMHKAVGAARLPGTPDVSRPYGGMMERQFGAQREFAPLLLATHVPYLLGVLATVVLAILVLVGRPAARGLAIAAAVACIARIGVGYASYRVSASAVEGMPAMMQEMVDQAEEQAQKNRPGGPADEQAKQMAKQMTRGVFAGVGTIASGFALVMTIGITLVVAGFWATVAILAMRKPRPRLPLPAPPGAPAG